MRLIMLSDAHELGRTSLDEGSDRRNDPYLYNTQQPQTPMPPGGIRTRSPSKRSAADLRLRPPDHRNRLVVNLITYIKNFVVAFITC